MTEYKPFNDIRYKDISHTSKFKFFILPFFIMIPILLLVVEGAIFFFSRFIGIMFTNLVRYIFYPVIIIGLLISVLVLVPLSFEYIIYQSKVSVIKNTIIKKDAIQTEIQLEFISRFELKEKISISEYNRIPKDINFCNRRSEVIYFYGKPEYSDMLVLAITPENVKIFIDFLRETIKH